MFLRQDTKNTITPGQSGPGSIGNEGIFHTRQISRAVVPKPEHHILWDLLFCRGFSQLILNLPDRDRDKVGHLVGGVFRHIHPYMLFTYIKYI